MDTTTEDEETTADVDAAADVDELVNSIHDSTTERMATASTAAPNANPSRKATLTARPTRIGRTTATNAVMVRAADGGEQH